MASLSLREYCFARPQVRRPVVCPEDFYAAFGAASLANDATTTYAAINSVTVQT